MPAEALTLCVVDAGRAAELQRVWADASAHRQGRPAPHSIDTEDLRRLHDRLSQPRVVAVAGITSVGVVSCGFGEPLLTEGGLQATDSAHVSLISVKPEHWGLGYGRQTLDFLEAALGQAGYTSAQLHVLETNTRARALYERNGWSLVRLGDPHPEGPQAVYEKSLPNNDA